MARAAILYEAHRPLVVTDVEVLPPKRGEVLVKMVAGGICHSDLHVMKGDIPAPMPAVLGHEGAGVVEAVGEDVTSVKPGDHVILLWRASCGHCYFCGRGRPALCDMGAGIRWSGRLPDGTTRFRLGDDEIRHFAGVSSFSEYSVLLEEAVVPIRKDVPLDKAALVGCAVMTGVGAVINTARVEPGASVVVIGAGGVGLNVIQGAALAGAERVIAVDLLDNKLEYAKQFGATHTINGRGADVVEAVKELTEGRGADYAFEVIGLPQTIRQAYEVVRRGGTAVVVGVAPTSAEVSINASSIMLQEKTLRGSLYGSCTPRVDIPRLLGLYVAGKLKLDELITRQYPLDQINEAFGALERGEVARSVVRFE